MKHRARMLALSVAAVALAACGDPKPKVPTGPVEGAPISGAPIDAPVVPAPAPQIGDLGGADEPTVPVVPPLTPHVPTVTLPVPPVTPPVEPTAPATPTPSATAPAAPSVPGDPPAPAAEIVPAIPPTTASQADKPTLPDRPVDAAKVAADAAKAPPDASAKAPGKGFIPKDHKKGNVIELTFEQLASFDFVPPPLPPMDSDAPPPDPAIALEAARKQIPAEIWELEGETVSVEGYMIPLEYADEGVKAFLISRHAMGCCFGVMPRAHELVECDLGEGKSTPYIGYLPVKITGVFHVGPKEGASTILSGIYRMDEPKVTIPEER